MTAKQLPPPLPVIRRVADRHPESKPKALFCICCTDDTEHVQDAECYFRCVICNQKHGELLMTAYAAQQAVAANVAQRGYRDGWTDEQFAARQVAKLIEEAAELAETVHTYTIPRGLSRWWKSTMHEAGKLSRTIFDGDVMFWDRISLDTNRAKAELTDVVVAALTLAQALGFDVCQAAVEKSAVDVARGKR